MLICISKDQNQCIEGLFSKSAPFSGDFKKYYVASINFFSSLGVNVNRHVHVE